MLEKEILSRLLRKTLSGGGDYADVFVEWRRPTYIHLEDGRIEKAVSGTECGVGVRLIFSGKTAFAFSNDLREKTLLEMAATLSRASGGGGSGGVFDLSRKEPSVDFEVKLPPDSVPVPRKVGLVRAADAAARGVDPAIRQAKVIYRDSVQKVQVANSDGFLAEDERVHTVGLVQVVASADGVVQTGYEPLGGLRGFELFEEYPLEEAALRASRRAVMMLKAERIRGGRMPVVISSKAGGTMIHEAIGHGLEADLAGQGLSKYSGKLGQKVASELVTVVDDGTLPGRRGSFRFDDEGTPSQSTVLVRNGVLENYMYDRLSAMRDGVPCTGNGRRESYRHRPIPRMTNTFIAPGESSPGEVLRSTRRGLYVLKMGGGQVNTVNGDFVFEVQEGYIIEDGEAGRPVRGATLTGNGPGVLASIDMVASDLGFAIGTCGKDSQGVPVSDAMPTLRVPELVVGGEV